MIICALVRSISESNSSFKKRRGGDGEWSKSVKVRERGNERDTLRYINVESTKQKVRACLFRTSLLHAMKKRTSQSFFYDRPRACSHLENQSLVF